MWLLSFRNINSGLIGDAPTGSFFETGAASAGFQSNMLDMVLSTNKDTMIVYKVKKFQLGVTANFTGNSTATTAILDNSKFHSFPLPPLTTSIISPLPPVIPPFIFSNTGRIGVIADK